MRGAAGVRPFPVVAERIRAFIVRTGDCAIFRGPTAARRTL
jgi:hypothetical protein